MSRFEAFFEVVGADDATLLIKQGVLGVRKRYDGGHGVDCDDDYELDDVDIVRQTHLRATCLTGACAGITVICEHFNATANSTSNVSANS